MDSKECYIIGGGPSLTNFNWRLLDHKYVIAVNRAYEKCPFAQILYFTDMDYWKRHHVDMKNHGGKLIRGVLTLNTTHDESVDEYLFTGSRGIETQPKKLRHGNNSTYAAINLALFQLNFDTVYLLGVDMKWGQNKQSHWHDGHARVDPEVAYEMMKANHNLLATELNVKHPTKHVINVNDNSALTCYPTVSYESVFGPDCFHK